jgi:RimJ/RimL family protein N-acetyltransferase
MAKPVNTMRLRPVEDKDFDVIFEMMRDPVAVRLAAFTAADPNDRKKFNEHIEMLCRSAEISFFAIKVNAQCVGTIATFPDDDDREVTYWVARAFWGNGIASQALNLLLQREQTRPLSARAASSNERSIAVLKKSGFVETGQEISFAEAPGADIEETLFTLA